jgi:SpoVK/Ycf46/Vps4 family AAA+-type ATPase
LKFKLRFHLPGRWSNESVSSKSIPSTCLMPDDYKSAILHRGQLQLIISRCVPLRSSLTLVGHYFSVSLIQFSFLLQVHGDSSLLSYDGLLCRLAVDCDGFSGAALAGVARAAASHALERAVNEFSEKIQEASGESPSIMDCLVTQDDFYEAITDVQNSMGTHDHSDDLDTAGSEESAGKK